MSQEPIVITITPSDSFIETGKPDITGYNLSASGVPVWALGLNNEKIKKYSGFIIIKVELRLAPSGIMLEKMKSGIVKLTDADSTTNLSLIHKVSILDEVYQALRFSPQADEFMMMIPEATGEIKPSLLFYDNLITEQKNQIKSGFLRGIAEKVRGSTEQSEKGE